MSFVRAYNSTLSYARWRHCKYLNYQASHQEDAWLVDLQSDDVKSSHSCLKDILQMYKEFIQFSQNKYKVIKIRLIYQT